jgi:hypothetical protein
MFTERPTRPVVCTIKALEKAKLLSAAARAIRVNPTNAPPRHLLLLGATQGVALPSEYLAVMTQRRWPPSGCRLTVGFMDNPPLNLRSRILSHMNAWSEFANVQFSETTNSPQVRISRGEGGYWSLLGTDVLAEDPNRATLNLASFTMETADSEFYRVVRHETGHTLGFPHEHQRKEIVNNIDSAKAIAYFRSLEGWEAPETTEQVLTALDDSALLATAQADPKSIMCYWLPGEIMKDGLDVNGGDDIDDQDAVFAGSVYPKNPLDDPRSLTGKISGDK